MGKNAENFKQPPLKPLGQCCSNFLGSLLGAGELEIAKMVAVPFTKMAKMAAMPIYGKNL